MTHVENPISAPSEEDSPLGGQLADDSELTFKLSPVKKMQFSSREDSYLRSLEALSLVQIF